MTVEAERRLLQLAVALACLVPFSIGGIGIVESAAGLKGVEHPLPIDLDSHFRYLSGLLLGIGIAFAACIRRIERRGAIFRALCLIVVVGGLARLLSLVHLGVPGPGHVFGLAMELGVVPLLTLWQSRVERLLTPQTKAEGPPGGCPTTLQTWSAAGCSSPEDLERTSLSSPERA